MTLYQTVDASLSCISLEIHRNVYAARCLSLHKYPRTDDRNREQRALTAYWICELVPRLHHFARHSLLWVIPMTGAHYDDSDLRHKAAVALLQSNAGTRYVVPHADSWSFAG